MYAFIGSLVSWLLKTFLQARIQLNEALVKADNLIGRVEADLKQKEDQKFRTALQQPLADVKAARNKTDPTDIDNARTALDQAWHNAQTTLAADRQTLATNIDDLKNVLEIAGTTPPILAADVKQAKTGLAGLEPLLAHDNILAGSQQLSEIRGQLGQQSEIAWNRVAAAHWAPARRRCADGPRHFGGYQTELHARGAGCKTARWVNQE